MQKGVSDKQSVHLYLNMHRLFARQYSSEIPGSTLAATAFLVTPPPTTMCQVTLTVTPFSGETYRFQLRACTTEAPCSKLERNIDLTSPFKPIRNKGLRYKILREGNARRECTGGILTNVLCNTGWFSEVVSRAPFVSTNVAVKR